MTWAATVAVAALACRPQPDALVLMDVTIAADVARDEIEFSVKDRPEVPRRRVAGRDVERPRFRLGYYMPGSERPIVIEAEARHAGGCGGRGAVEVGSVSAGAEIHTPPLAIVRTADCGGRGAGPSPADGGADGQDAMATTPPDEGVLAVLSFSPADRDKDADRRGPIRITFSQPLDPGSVGPDAVEVTTTGGRVAGSLALDPAGRSVAFTPAAPLPMLATVTVKATRALRSRSGEALEAERSASFSTADGAWQPAEHIQMHEFPFGVSPGALALTSHSSGHAIVVWEHVIERLGANDLRSVLHASRYVPRVGWGHSEALDRYPEGTLPVGQATDPQLVMTADGTALLVHQQWLAPATLIPRAGTLTSTLRWFTNDGKAWVKQPDTLDAQTEGIAHNPKLVSGPTGEVVAVWQWDGPREKRLEARRRVLGAWTEPARFSVLPAASTVDVRLIGDVAIDAMGNAFTIWLHGQLIDTYPGSIWTNRFAIREGWATGTRISSIGPTVQAEPRLAMDGQGNARAAWVQIDPEAMRVYTASYSVAAGRWEAAEAIGPSEVGFPELALNWRGDELLAWGGNRSLTVRRTTANTWTQTEFGPATGAMHLRVGIDDAGYGTLIYAQVNEPGRPLVALRFARESGPRETRLSVGEVTGPTALHVLPDGRAFATWVEEGPPHRLTGARFE